MNSESSTGAKYPTVKISSEELPDNNTPCSYDLRDGALKQLYLFYKNHSQKNVYMVKVRDEDRESKSFFLSSNIDEFGSYGVYLNHGVVDLSNKKFILILKREDLESREALADAITRASDDYGCGSFSAIVIEKIYHSGESFTNDNNMITDLLPLVPFVNSGFKMEDRKQVYEGTSRKGATNVDVAKFFDEHNITHRYVSLNIQNICKITKEIEDVYSPRVIYHYSGNLKNYIKNAAVRCKEVFAMIAAYYSSVKGYNFDVHSYDEVSFFFAGLDALRDSNYYFASDYVRMMANPLRNGLSYRNGDLFICRFDANNSGNRSAIRVIYTTFNENGQDSFFDDDAFRQDDIFVTDIEVLKIEDLYDIRSRDWNDAVSGLRAIDGFCLEFEKSLSSYLGSSLEIPVCFNNLLLFRMNGKVYVGYIATRIIELHYNLYNFADMVSSGKFNPIHIKMNDLTSVHDFCILADGFGLRAKWMKATQCTRAECTTIFPEYVRGIIFSKVQVTKEMFDASCGATVAELGVWSKQTTQLRGRAAKNVLDNVTNVGAWTSGLLSYFGGPHPAVRTRVNIPPKAWR